MTARVVNFRGGEQIVVPYPLNLIRTSHNPRRPVPRLQRQGIVPLDFLHENVLSGDSEKAAVYIKAIKENAPEIVSLAYSIRDKGQIEPVVLRTFRSLVGHDDQGNGIYERRGGIACGERRVLACGFLEAERVCSGDSKKPITVDAICVEMTVEEARQIGWDENKHRKSMSELDWGYEFDRVLRQLNPATGRLYTIGEVAQKYEVNYHWCRTRAALPYLPPEWQARLPGEGAPEGEELNIVPACVEALKCKAAAIHKLVGQVPDLGISNDGPTLTEAIKTRKRRNALNRSQIEKLFDMTPHENTERIKAFSEVLQISVQEAIQESNKRKEEAKEKEVRAENRKRKGEAA